MIPLPSLEASHLERLLDIDHWDREAVVALVNSEVVGMASYARIESRRDVAGLAPRAHGETGTSRRESCMAPCHRRTGRRWSRSWGEQQSPAVRAARPESARRRQA